jgi:hypothetical protein
LFKLLGAGIFVSRISSILFFGGFLALFGVLVNRLWGKRIALFATLLGAVSSWPVLWYSFRSNSNTALLLLFGTAALWLSLPLMETGRFSKTRLIALGIVIGLGVWSNPMMIFYLLILAALFYLQAPEWHDWRDRITGFASTRWGINGSLTFSFIFLGIACLLSLGFFTRFWQPAAFFYPAAKISLGLLLIIAPVMALLFVIISRRRMELFTGTALLGTGFALGNFPQWASWVFEGLRPGLLAGSSSPSGLIFRSKLVFGEILPAFWGIPPLYSVDLFESIWRRNPVEIPLWIAVTLIAVAALGRFVWLERKVIRDLFTLATPVKKDNKTLALFLMFLLPILSGLISGSTVDYWCIKYLIVAWQAGAVITAMLLAYLWTRSRVAGLAVIGISVIAMGAANLTDVNRRWSQGAGCYSAQTIHSIRKYMDEYGARGGYADNWVAFGLTLAGNSEIAFCPYNLSSHNRFPEYYQRAAASPVQAYIFYSPESDLQTTSTHDDLMKALEEGVGLGEPIRADILQSLKKQTVLDRRQINKWDVWMVGEPADTAQSKIS